MKKIFSLAILFLLMSGQVKPLFAAEKAPAPAVSPAAEETDDEGYFDGDDEAGAPAEAELAEDQTDDIILDAEEVAAIADAEEASGDIFAEDEEAPQK